MAGGSDPGVRERRLAEDRRQLETAVERERQARKGRIGLPRSRVPGEWVRVREHVVRDDEAAHLEERTRQREERVVVLLLGVEEDEVEGVLGLAQHLEGVPFRELGPVVEPRAGDVRTPCAALLGVMLDRDDAPRLDTCPRREPDRRVAARAAKLEHVDARLGGCQREQEATRRRLHLPRAPFRGQPRLALGPILSLEAGQDGQDALVEHYPGTSTTSMPSRSTTGKIG